MNPFEFKDRIIIFSKYILIILILISFSILIYIILVPERGEEFTEFYLLDMDRHTSNLPKNLNLHENVSILFGIVNHEYRTINYTIEIWLINESIEYNNTLAQYQIIFNHMLFIDKLNITLDHIEINLEDEWKPQWEILYQFNPIIKGDYKLTFLLFKNPTDSYDPDVDYRDIAEKKINEAYRNLHLFVSVK